VNLNATTAHLKTARATTSARVRIRLSGKWIGKECSKNMKICPKCGGFFSEEPKKEEK